MGMMQEFKEFAVKGNAVDMAVGLVVGGAFGKVVSSLVSDVIMPPIGVMMGGTDFSKLGYVLQEAQGDAAPVVLKWGAFVQNIVDFLIIAFAIFMVVKGINNLKKAEEEAPDEPDATEVLLTEIRDSLKK